MPLDFDDVMKGLESDDLTISTNNTYTEEYKDIVFYIWYNEGKPQSKRLQDLIPIPETANGRKPSLNALHNWTKDFIVRAKTLDDGVRESLNNALVQTKIEMLKRHVAIAKEMQEIGIGWLKNNIGELTGASAVRMATEGIRIERESVGIPGALQRMSEKTDEELLQDVVKLLEESKIEIEEKDE